MTGETQPIIRIVEVLPAPFGPRNPNDSPGATSKSTASTAVKSPNRLVSAAGMDERGRAGRVGGGRARRRDGVGHGRAWYRTGDVQRIPEVASNWVRKRATVAVAGDARSAPVPWSPTGAKRWPPSPTPVAELLDAALVGELTVVDDAGRPVTYPLIPLWDGEKDLPDLVDPVQPQARAHQGEPEGLGLDHRPGRGRRAGRPGDDPGRCPDHRGGPARRLGAAPADLGGQGAVDRLLPQGARRAAALLRAGAHRDHAAARPVLVRRGAIVQPGA